MKHWTGDDFTQWIYGLKDDQSHLDECSECKQQAARLVECRNQSRQAPEVSWEFLAAQRRGIYRRLGTPIRNWAPVRWATSFAMLVMVAVLSFNLMHEAPVKPLAPTSDDKLFSELVSIEQSNEPRAIKPIRGLFEE